MKTSLKNGVSKESLLAYLMLAPFVILFTLFIIQPTIGAVIMSFQSGSFANMKFVGFTNYTRLLKDPLILKTFLNTLQFVVVSSTSLMFFSVLFALWAQDKTKLSGFIRIAFYIPSVLVITIMTSIFILMLRPGLGLWHYLTINTPLNTINWFQDRNFAKTMIVLATLWWTVGGNMLIIITSLRTIPIDIIEAARLDGARPLRIFFKITMPHIMPTLVVLTTLQVIASFKLFGQPLVLTKGGPDHATRSIVQYIYDVGFTGRNPGYAAAISVVFMVFLMVMMVVFQKLGDKKHD